MSDIARNIITLREEIPANVRIVAVSKLKSADDILKAYNAGQKIFGENRVQELVRKYNSLPRDIEWHFIGHLQSNKVRQIASFVNMIHSVDSFRLLQVIDREAAKAGRIIDCLLQFYIATEETKYGFSLSEVLEMLESEDFQKLKNIRICGVMGMASFIDDDDQIRREFMYLSECFRRLKDEFFSGDDAFKELSMGMSGDYKIALEEGSTIVRLGSTIFGSRYQG
ncbi:MAG TPA: YggS family pyridoxal phosphate-dependent enzyme [Bacteroidales bacterium]|jgi:pyridoxal phosphate enzyme (YggS family)|nr:YggS family pyridoxal phosphate-dependent enzyme [Bacteroidales bacterium]